MAGQRLCCRRIVSAHRNQTEGRFVRVDAAKVRGHTFPPMSDPNEIGPKPAATAAADTPDGPPGERLRSHGFLVVP
jgi:hypothetical protein